MNRRSTGVSFIAIATVLYCTRFITAAIWGSGISSWDSEKFAVLLSYVDQGLAIWSTVALAIGVIYLVWGEINAMQKRRASQNE